MNTKFILETFLIIAAGVLALAPFSIFGRSIYTKLKLKEIKGNALSSVKERSKLICDSYLQMLVLSFIERQTKMIALDQKKFIARGILARHGSFDRLIVLSGNEALFSIKGVLNSRIYLSFLLGLGGFLFGFIFSFELALLCCLIGLCFGFNLPKSVLKSRSLKRAEDLEKHLPQMLDVIAIGIRSGLSFDRALQIYASTFESALSKEFSLAQKMWSSGLRSREDSLRALSKTYESQIFSRLIESLIRSLKLGSSMLETLESCASQSRSLYRERMEERVRKAPIKMMIPTGTLILPAMLILVLGPVLLQLINGGGL